MNGIWLFELLAKHRVPICCLATDRLDEMFNIRDPKVTIDQTKNLIWKGLQSGYFEVLESNTRREVNQDDLTDLLIPIPISLRPTSPYLGITQLGSEFLSQNEEKTKESKQE